jgi:hypothetical protein
MTAGVTSYRNLEVWQFAVNWILLVYRSSAGWPRDERFGLTSQVRRAAVSVASNIAARLGYLEPDAENRLLAAADRISRMLVSLAAALRDRKSR